MSCNRQCPVCCPKKSKKRNSEAAPISSPDKFSGPTIVIRGRWKLGALLGAGSFGQVYMAKDVSTGEKVAVKTESVGQYQPFLAKENEVYKGLRNTDSKVIGFPKARFYGRFSNKQVLVMDCLGPSVQSCWVRCGRMLSVKSVSMLGIQLLRRVQLLHHKGFLHRDIKPDNMLIGASDPGRVYLVDFGLALKYRDYDTQKHIPYREGRGVIGTCRYASINAHLGIEQSRRDDLESLGYSLLFLHTGSLPWQNIRDNDEKTRLRRICERKQGISHTDLCKGLPQMEKYFQYVRDLRFKDRPDYSYLRTLLRNPLEEQGITKDRVFDWMTLQQ